MSKVPTLLCGLLSTLMTAPIYPILLMLAKLDAPSQAMLLSQIDRFFFASPHQRRALIRDWQRLAQHGAQSALT